MKRRRSLIITFLVLLLVGICVWQTYGIGHQAVKNRALIAAVKANNLVAVKSALESGADPNARDNSSSLSEAWLEAIHQLLRRKHAPREEPALALAHDMNNEDITMLLLQHGADRYIVQEWDTLCVLPKEEEAIRNGIVLLRIWKSATPIEASERLKPYIGKRVAFLGFEGPPKMQIDDDVYLDVDFIPAEHPSPPIVTESVIVGTVESVDRQKKVILIRAKFSDWNILGTG